MMIDADVVAVSPSSTYRVLRQAGRLDRHWQKPSKKGSGFVQPLVAHEHWHVDMSYINVAGTFYYLTSILDGYSRAIVHAEVRESMTEARTWKPWCSGLGKEKYPQRRPANHQRQRPAVHCPRVQGVYPHRRHDTRTHQPLLSTVEREVGALARIAQMRVHSTGGAA